ncbi:MAG: type IX secretion system membrane protein PorP/SprF [Bacteroidota bacterium]|nr:type IX secretion system membrane protein PorP/SprF [Bacteroidota bacterium]
MKNKKLLLLVFLCLLACKLQAQQRPVFSQYMFNGLVLNPAYAGSQKQLSATGIFRKQWVNIEGAPSTLNATVHSGFEKKEIGMGLMISNDIIGIHNDLGVYVSYAYQITMERGTLAMGIQGGFNNLNTDFNKLNLKYGRDPILFGKVSNFNPNFGTGLYYSTQTSYIGFSVPFIINNRVFQGQEIINYAKEARYYFLSAGKVFDVHPSVKLKPSTLIRVQEGAPVGFDANINVILEDIISFGTSYRSNDAVVLLFHVIANENFTFGYAYDWTLSALNPHTRGSHEIMVNYRINLTSKPCHSYF